MMVAQALTAILSFVGLSIMTRYLGVDTFGSLSWALALVVTFNSIADLGFGTAHIKRVSEGKDIGECISTFALCKVVLTVGMVIAIVIFLLLSSSDKQLEGNGLNMVMLFVLYYIFYDVASIAIVTFDARQETASTQISYLIDPLLRIPLIAIFALGGMGVMNIVVAYIVGGFGLMVFSLYLLSRARIQWKKPTLVRYYAAFAVPYAAVTIMGAVSANMDKILLGVFWTNTEVGYYTAGQSVVNMLTLIGASVSTLVFPAFSKLHSEGNTEQIRAITRNAERYVSMISLPLIITLVIFPGEIMAILFGAQFSNGGESLQFLAIALFISLLNVAYGAQIGAFNFPATTAKLTILTVGANFIFFLILVPSNIGGVNLLALGAGGAALAKVLGYVAVFFITRRLAFSLSGTKSNPRIMIHIFVAILTGIALEAISGFWNIVHWHDALLFLTISYAMFTFLLFAFKEFRKEDTTFILSVVNPSEMWAYIKGELRDRTPRS